MQKQLIEAVRKHSVLYDIHDIDYSKSKLRDKVWNSIARELNLKHGNEAKRYWLKLRNCHREALRRQKNCLNSGVPAATVKLWKYQKLMEFLLPYMSNRVWESNLENDVVNESTQDQSEDTDSIDFDSKNIEIEYNKVSENISQNKNIIGQTENLSTHDIATKYDIRNKRSLEKSQGCFTFTKSAPVVSSTPTTSGIASKIKRFSEEDTCSTSKESLQHHEKRTQERALQRKELEQVEKPVDDALYHFYMSMYEITKTLPLTHQHTIRNNVFQIVSQAEADYLQINNKHNL